MKKRKILSLATLVPALVLSLFAACSGTAEKPSNIVAENIPLASGAPESTYRQAVASGTKTETSQTVVLDYSNTSDGYVMLKYSGSNKKVKTQLTGVSG